MHFCKRFFLYIFTSCSKACFHVVQHKCWWLPPGWALVSAAISLFASGLCSSVALAKPTKKDTQHGSVLLQRKNDLVSPQTSCNTCVWSLFVMQPNRTLLLPSGQPESCAQQCATLVSCAVLWGLHLAGFLNATLNHGQVGSAGAAIVRFLLSNSLYVR